MVLQSKLLNKFDIKSKDRVCIFEREDETTIKKINRHAHFAMQKKY